jgi:hypothetical protein
MQKFRYGIELGSRVADPDPNSSGKMDPDPHLSQNSALEAQNEAVEGTQTGGVEAQNGAVQSL